MKKRILFLVAIICLNISTKAASISSTITGGTYSATTTWSGGVVPGVGDDVTIVSGATVTVTDNRTCNSLTVNGTTVTCILQINSGVTLTVSGATIINAPTANTVTGTIAVGDGILSCATLTTISPTTSNTRQCIISINTGTITCSGNLTMGANTNRNLLTFTSSGLLQLGGSTNTLVDAQFTPATGTIEYNMAGAQSVLNLSYYSLKCSTSGIKSLVGATSLTGNLTIAGTAQLDAVSGSNYGLNVGGNWNVTSTNALPFNAQAGTVILNGATTQNVTTVLAGGEVFYNLTISNTSGSNPGVQINQNQTLLGSTNLNFTKTTTLTVTGNLKMNSTSTITGSATGILNVNGTFSDIAGGSETIGRVTMNVTGAASLGGTLTISSANSTVNFNGGLTMANNCNITFGAAGAITVGTSLTCNGTNSVTYSTAGSFSSVAVTINGTTTFDGVSTGTTNFTSTVSVPASAVLNIGNTALTITNGLTIGGNVNFTNATGTKTFNNITISAGGTWNASAVDQTYYISGGNLTNSGTFNAGLTTATIYNFSGASQINGTLTIPSVAVTGGGSTTTNNGTLTISNQLSGSGTFAQGGGGYLYLTLSSVAVTTLSASTASNTINYSLAGTQTVKNTTYYHLIISTSGTKTLAGTTSVSGNLTVSGTSQLDVNAAGPYTFNVAGSWNITSTNADPFLEQTGTVTFNGSVGTQTVTTVLAAGETFYNLTTISTSTTSPGVKLSQKITINNKYLHTSGILDLNSFTLKLTGASAVAGTSRFTSGSIITSVAGGSITITDLDTLNTIYYEGTNFGDATNGVSISHTSSQSYFNGGIFYGTVNFTKSGANSSDCDGGCTFYGPCTFNTTVNGNRWRMGCTNPDIFYNASFNHLDTTAGYNFSVARSTGNHFYGTTSIYSAAQGGFYVGRSNNTASGSATFHGPVTLTVTATGNVYFGESNGTINNSSTFQSTLQLNSTASSTGDIYIGTNNASTSINFTNTGQLIDGTISGATNVYFYGVTQTGGLTQTTTNSAASNSTMYLGSATIGNTWNGSVTFTAPNINLASSTYNGTTNNFTANGTASLTCTGGNTFAAGTTTNFANNGLGIWRLANTTSDNYNGDVTFFRAAGAGNLSPSYSSNCSYAGNITILANSDSIDFASGGSGVVTLSGSTSATFTNYNSAKSTSMKRVTVNKTGGASFTLGSSVGVPSGGTLLLTSGLLNTSSSAYLYLMNETCTAPSLTSSSTSYINGPMRYDVSANGTTQTLNFPIGKSTNCRPVVLTVRHNSGTSYSYMGEVFNSSARDLGYTYPATIDTVSDLRYWTIDRTVTSSGAAASATNLSYSANNYPLIQLYFDVTDSVYQGANLTIVKNTAASPTTWIDIGATCALGNTATPQAGSITSTTSGTPFNSFSKFTLASKLVGWNPLPIELLEFTAIPHDTKVDLKWSTSTETNNAYFTVEKSVDAKTFTKVIDVPSAGNSVSLREYFETDYQPYTGLSYYRLKQTDKNGAFKYSQIVQVNFAAKKNMSVFPNPVDNATDLNLLANGYKGKEILVVLRDMQGREFFSKIMLVTDNNQLFAIDATKNIPSGSYIIVASSDDKIFSQKIIVK